ncbi:hypothetical protein GOP47_0024565 [Adiantum capillus-veneris]|uniref:Uncharacterized protein n=1 Tax=Adiantum capillus-veneris TaxID=13818 RepID=A0A9D4Z3S0_ADICA|nr:hypothetical protein GOP47_0024565 [Adiantum capillus-veneris]
MEQKEGQPVGRGAVSGRAAVQGCNDDDGDGKQEKLTRCFKSFAADNSSARRSAIQGDSSARRSTTQGDSSTEESKQERRQGRTYIYNTTSFNCTSVTPARQHCKIGQSKSSSTTLQQWSRMWAQVDAQL